MTSYDWASHDLALIRRASHVLEPKIAMGVALGQNQDPTGLCVMESEKIERMVEVRGEGRTLKMEEVFNLRLLERLPPDASLPVVTDRVAEVFHGLQERETSPDLIYLDTTGMGLPILEHFRAFLPKARIEGICLTPGDTQSEEDERTLLGKKAMISRLKILLETKRLRLPERDRFKALASELRRFRTDRVEEGDRLFRVGANDEQITAIGMAVLKDPRPRWFVC